MITWSDVCSELERKNTHLKAQLEAFEESAENEVIKRLQSEVADLEKVIRSRNVDLQIMERRVSRYSVLLWVANICFYIKYFCTYYICMSHLFVLCVQIAHQAKGSQEEYGAVVDRQVIMSHSTHTHTHTHNLCAIGSFMITRL